MSASRRTAPFSSPVSSLWNLPDHRCGSSTTLSSVMKSVTVSLPMRFSLFVEGLYLRHEREPAHFDTAGCLGALALNASARAARVPWRHRRHGSTRSSEAGPGVAQCGGG